MIRHTDSLVFVWKVSELEAQHLGSSLIEPEHLFLGLLKSVDVDLSKLRFGKANDAATMAVIARDLTDVRTAFQQAEIDTTAIRRRLRRRIGRAGSKRSDHLRRSSQSRAVFKFAEAFVKSGKVKPVQLLSILAETKITSVIEVFEQSGISNERLLEASTIIALTPLTSDSDADSGMNVSWMQGLEKLKQDGWIVSWTRSFRNNFLLWNVEISRNGIRRVVQAENINEALIEIQKSI